MIRLIEVLVQPILVDDDGDTLRKVDVPAQAVQAADWPGWPTDGFPALLAQVEGQLAQNGKVEA
jgi:hypothetical protein